MYFILRNIKISYNKYKHFSNKIKIATASVVMSESNSKIFSLSVHDAYVLLVQSIVVDVAGRLSCRTWPSCVLICVPLYSRDGDNVKATTSQLMSFPNIFASGGSSLSVGVTENLSWRFKNPFHPFTFHDNVFPQSQ